MTKFLQDQFPKEYLNKYLDSSCSFGRHKQFTLHKGYQTFPKLPTLLNS